MAQQTENKTFSRVIATVKHEVESGAAFAESLAKHPTVFNERYTNMVSAGEMGGMLDTILVRLAAYMELARFSIRRGLISSLVFRIS